MNTKQEKISQRRQKYSFLIWFFSFPPPCFGRYSELVVLLPSLQVLLPLLLLLKRNYRVH